MFANTALYTFLVFFKLAIGRIKEIQLFEFRITIRCLNPNPVSQLDLNVVFMSVFFH